MKKNKKSRIFSRVLSRLSWATFYRVCEEHLNEYKEVLAAKRLIEDFGGEDVKSVFYDREWHIQFTLYHGADNCYYTVGGIHGYTNDFCATNRVNFNRFIERLEVEYSCALRRDYLDFQRFQQYADSVLFWILSRSEYEDYWRNGSINAIPYDVAFRLWRDLRECAGSVVDEAIAHRKEVL